jgi:glutathione synthase|tara:strand:+ start:4594 stop:5598 length:1005 start_codon:yes stop_codon:yes gene_type:complete
MTAPRLKIGILIDPVHNIKPKKDTSLAIMLAAQNAGHDVFVMEQGDVFIENGHARGIVQGIEVFDDTAEWCKLSEKQDMPLAQLDIIFMRKDPPVDKRFIHTTYVLDQAAAEGVTVTNPPATLRDFNEKIFASTFTDYTPPYTITTSQAVLKEFLSVHKKIIMKPLDGMGGEGVFMVTEDDVNFDVIWETLTGRGSYPIIAQRFIPAIKQGDKRIIIIDGTPFPYMLVRLPKDGSIRGNLAVSGDHEVRKLDEKDLEIAAAVGKRLRQEGILLAGIDIIGTYLTEVNITSPTGFREIARISGQDPATLLLEKAVELHCRKSRATDCASTDKAVA